MNTEQQQQLAEIQERVSNKYESASSRNVITVAALALKDVDFLLSIVEKQEANAVAAARGVAKEYVALSLSLVKGIDHLRNDYWQRAKGAEAVMERLQGKTEEYPTDIAASMRSLCIEKVKGMRDVWRKRYAILNDTELVLKLSLEGDIRVATEVIEELESLTLQEQEAKHK